MKIQLISVIGIEIVDIDLFYHFINYYNPYVDQFSLVFNYQSKNIKDTIDAFYQLVPQNKRKILFWHDKFTEDIKTNYYINYLIDTMNTSSLIADHDEFIEFKDDFFKCPKNQCNVGNLIQRVAISDSKIIFPKIQKNKNLFDQFPYKKLITFRASRKICYVHNGMHVIGGHHCLKKWTERMVHEDIYIETDVHHFKYDSYFTKSLDNSKTIFPNNPEFLQLENWTLEKY